MLETTQVESIKHSYTYNSVSQPVLQAHTRYTDSNAFPNDGYETLTRPVHMGPMGLDFCTYPMPPYPMGLYIPRLIRSHSRGTHGNPIAHAQV
jgi:hypothetical protein